METIYKSFARLASSPVLWGKSTQSGIDVLHKNIPMFKNLFLNIAQALFVQDL